MFEGDLDGAGWWLTEAQTHLPTATTPNDARSSRAAPGADGAWRWLSRTGARMDPARPWATGL